METSINEYFNQNIEGKTKEEVSEILKVLTIKYIDTKDAKDKAFYGDLIEYINHKVFNKEPIKYSWRMNSKTLKENLKDLDKYSKKILLKHAKQMKKKYKEYDF